MVYEVFNFLRAWERLEDRLIIQLMLDIAPKVKDTWILTNAHTVILRFLAFPEPGWIGGKIGRGLMMRRVVRSFGLGVL